MQPHDASGPVNRRGFLQTSAVAATAASVGAASTARAQDAKPAEPEAKVLPKRKLGKTGVEVTILNQGTWQAPGLDRLLRFGFANGIRYFDTAKSYGSEPAFKRWFQQQPEVRKQIFLVTKDTPRQASDLARMVDERLEALGTDYIDLFFMHALGDHSVEEGVTWPKDVEFARAVEKIKASGKIKHFGFSTHHKDRAKILNAAAEGNYVDAVMLQYTPWLDKDSELNKALDACHAKDIGLISMKQVAGQFNPGGTLPTILQQVTEKVKSLKERELTPFGGLLHAIWTDERISTACVSLRNTDHIRENAETARKFANAGPLQEADIRDLRDASRAHGMTLCADCDGRCAAAAGTTARLGDLTRYLTYYEHHGVRGDARRLYAELAQAERDWKRADLAAAQKACPNRLDFTRLMPEVDRLLGRA